MLAAGLRQHHLPGAQHAAPACIAREGGSLDRREALPVREPNARPQVADQLRQRLRVGILTLAAVGFTKEVDRGAGGDAEHLLSGHGHAQPVADGLGGAFDPVERAVHQEGERCDRIRAAHSVSARPARSINIGESVTRYWLARRPVSAHCTCTCTCSFTCMPLGKHDAAKQAQAAEARFQAKVRSRNRAPWRAGSCSLCQET